MNTCASTSVGVPVLKLVYRRTVPVDRSPPRGKGQLLSDVHVINCGESKSSLSWGAGAAGQQVLREQARAESIPGCYALVRDVAPFSFLASWFPINRGTSLIRCGHSENARPLFLNYQETQGKSPPSLS
jgi:hypothetical protein